jgi:hypothetical protein
MKPENQGNQNQYPFPHTDRKQASCQLQYLGRTDRDARLRFFYHGSDPRKDTDKGRKLEGLSWEAIAKYQQDNRGVYLVVNAGGHEDKDIKQYAAIFCEWDDIPVAEQLLLWQTLGFLEPTFTVYSGDKSAQPYWVFDAPLTVEQWRELQLLLIEVMGADPANKNPSRVFRLAGGWHVKPGREPVRTEIVQDSGIKYSYSQLRERLLELKALKNPESVITLIPQPEPVASDIVKLIGSYTPLRQCGGNWRGDCVFCNAVDKLLVNPSLQSFECLNCYAGGDADNYANTADDFLRKYQRPVRGGHHRSRYQDISVPVPESVPLEVCLSKDSRALLESGVSQGGRNTNGAKLARDLIGTASHLQGIGQRFVGDPRLMLDDYAARCNPPVLAKEVEAIWKSALKDRPGPSCTPDGVEACVRGWYWNNHVLPNQPSPGSASGGSGGSGGRGRGHGFGAGSGGNNHGDGGNNPPLFAVTLCDRIKDILHRYDSQSMRDAALMDLAAAVDRPFREVEQLSKVLQLETELSEDATAAVQSLKKLLKTRRTSLNPHDYFEGWFADLLQLTADAMPTAVEFLITTLLPVAAACIGTSSRIVIKPSAGYVQPLVIWSAIVGQSGGLKTPAQKAIVKPLVKLEEIYYEQYKEALKVYQEEVACRRAHPEEFEGEPDPVPPVRRRLVTKDCTLEKLQRIHGDNSRGLLYYRDELAGGAKSRNQYRGGFGADLEAELDQFNGAEIIYDRGDKEVFLPKSCICRTGGYQWEVAAQMMDAEGDYTGMNARWLLDGAKAPPAYIDLLSPDADTDTGLSDALLKLYTALGTVPDCDYLLSHDAKVLFQAFQHESVDQGTSEEHLGLQVVYPKNQSYVARLALLLHIVNATLRGETPSPVISGETMRQAIALAGYYLWQYRMIYKHNHPDSGLEGLGLKAHRFALKTGRVTASAIKRGVAAFKKVVTHTIRQVFESLSASGWGHTEGEGENMAYIPHPESNQFRANPVDAVDAVDAVDGRLIKSSTAKTSSSSGVEPKVDKIDKIDEPSMGLAVEDFTEPNDLNPGSDEVESIRQNQQFINSTPETPVEQPVEPVDDGPQPDYQLSTPLHESELLNDEEMAAWHTKLNACQTLDDATDFCTALDALTPEQRNQFESSVPDTRWAWLFGLPEVKEPEPSVSEVQESAPSQPEVVSTELTLEELKALLLACDSLVQLNELKRSHKKTTATVYRSMSEKEQAHVDALAALAVPHKVYKYLGDEIKQGTQRLIRGTLVYLDPRTQVRAKARSVLVWALNGVPSGWKQPIEVSLNLLKEVVKVVLPLDETGGQQMGLI